MYTFSSAQPYPSSTDGAPQYFIQQAKSEISAWMCVLPLLGKTFAQCEPILSVMTWNKF